eukprot:gene153-257_t
MPPVAKKSNGSKGKKASTAGLKVINQSDFQRERTEIPVLTQVPSLKTKLCGKIFDIEEIFPEWNIMDEFWNENIYSTINEPEYPAHIKIAEYRNVKEYFELTLDESEKAAKPKRERRASTKAADLNEMDELTQDEKGHPVPRIMLDTSTKLNTGIVNNEEALGYNIIWPFFNDSTGHKKVRLARDESDHSVDKDFHSDSDRDPLICAAFNLVSRFGPGILESFRDIAAATIGGGGGVMADPPFPYLWRAIYPKCRGSERPCFNPAGKYCVRLYLGGKWRKVTVSDVLPLASDGRPAIACSSEKYELWPSILAKAIYTVYTACGYNQEFPSVGVGEDGPVAARKCAAFLGFAVHVLTGWLPGNPWSLRDTVNDDIERYLGLVQEMVFGGLVKVIEDDIPDHAPVLKEKVLHEDMTGGDKRKMTKKQKKVELKRKTEEKNSLLRAITDREKKIERMDAALTRPFSEVFVVLAPAPTGGVKTLPVLGLSYVDGVGGENTLLLTHWLVKDSIEQVSQGAESIPGTLPGSTPIESVWMTVAELCQMGAFVIGIDTKIRTQNKASVSWHWHCPLEEDPKKKPKGKDKDKEKERSRGGRKESVDVRELDLTAAYEKDSFPPTFLKVDTVPFISNIPAMRMSPKKAARVRRRTFESSTSNPSEINEAIEAQRQAFAALDMKSTLEEDPHEMDDETESIMSQQSQLILKESNHLSSVLDSRTLRKKRNYLSMSIFLHTDTMQLKTKNKGAAVGDGDNDGMKNGDDNKPPMMDTVLVLQEIRSDGEEPLLVRVQIGSMALIPCNRVTFNIPAERITTKPLLFWVRLFTSSSLCLTVHCAAPITIGPAAEVWESLGGKAIVYSGDAETTPCGMERLLFSLPLQLTEEACEAVTNADTGDVSQQQQLPPLHHQHSSVHEDFALTFLSITQKDIVPYASIVVLENQSNNAMPMPLLEGNLVPISQKLPKTIIGRCLNSYSNIPNFSWKLTVLHQMAIVPTPQPQINTLERYQGLYKPNNKLVLFRDVLRVESQNFPLALRISLTDIPDMMPIEGITVPEDVCIVIRFYRKSNRKLLSEYRSKGVLQIYRLEEGPFVQSEEDLESSQEAVNVSTNTNTAGTASKHVAGQKAPAAATASKPIPKKDEKPKKDSKSKDVKETTEILMEACLDEGAMHIPPNWRSRVPYEFCVDKCSTSELPVGTIDGDSSPDIARGVSMSETWTRPGGEAQFMWRMDVLAGHISGVAHDTYDLERLAAIKNSWETAQEGREERAVAAASYVSESRKVVLGLGTSMDSIEPEQQTETTVDATNANAAHKSRPKSRDGSPSHGRKGPSISSSSSKRKSDAQQQETPPNPLDVSSGLLATALKLELDMVKAREELALTLPAYHEFVQYCTKSEDRVMVSKEESETQKEFRVEDVKESERLAVESVERLVKLNDSLRATTRTQILELVSDARGNTEELKRAWLLREKYKAYADAKNTSLKWLLEQSSQALETISSSDDSNIDPKDKRGKQTGKGKDISKQTPKKKMTRARIFGLLMLSITFRILAC